jgi:hypothetical protein
MHVHIHTHAHTYTIYIYIQTNEKMHTKYIRTNSYTQMIRQTRVTDYNKLHSLYVQNVLSYSLPGSPTAMEKTFLLSSLSGD